MGAMDRAVLAILIISLIARAFFLFSDTVNWDSAVYLEMGKYIFSFGKAGLWEASRPLLWPLMTGFLWKIKLEPIFFGKILTTLFSIACIYITYLIGRGPFNRKIALVSALFFSFSPTFFNNNPSLLSEIPSTLFSLLAVYLFIKNKNALSGFFFGIAFLTRFFQAMIPASLLFLLYSRRRNTHFLKKLYITFLFFIITIAPYFFINNFLYGDTLFPFSLQLFLTQRTGWFWFEPFSYYFVNILNENFISLFALLGIFLVFTKPKYSRITISIILLVVFVTLSLPQHKEMRFLIPVLPYLYILSSYGIFYFFSQLKGNRLIFFSAIAILFVLTAFQIFPALEEQTFYNDGEFQDYAQDLSGNIWVSNPTYLVKTDKKADELIYYPALDEQRAERLIGKLHLADSILLNTCDIPCNPKDAACPDIKEGFIEALKQNLETDYYVKTGDCERYIFISS